MTALAPKLEAVAAEIANAPKKVLEMIDSGLNVVQTKFATLDSVIQVGSKLPAFTLPDATGAPVSSSDLLTKGPLMITFYRGNWCPYCNIALHALGERLNEFHALGVELVAISPELPDTSLSTQEQNDLKYPVLSDEGNHFARELGIVWKQPDTLRPLFEGNDVDLEKRNGDNSFELPVPATFLVDKDGIVRNRYVEADYRKRVEPSVMLDWIAQL